MVMMDSESLRDAISVQRLDQHTYEKYFLPEYANGQAAHGGFIASLFAETARKHLSERPSQSDSPRLQNLHVEYVRPVSINAHGQFIVEEIKIGTAVNLLHIRLFQDGKVRALSDVRYGLLKIGDLLAVEPEIANWKKRRLPAPVNDRDQATARDDAWVRCRIKSDPYSRVRTHFDYILPVESRLRSTSVVEWIGPKAPSGYLTNECIPMICDLWPQIPDSFRSIDGKVSPYSSVGMIQRMLQEENPQVGMTLSQAEADEWVTNWYPTLSLELQIHKQIPSSGSKWLYQEVRTQKLTEGTMDIQLRIGDMDRDLVAVGLLSVLVVAKEKNSGGKGKL